MEVSGEGRVEVSGEGRVEVMGEGRGEGGLRLVKKGRKS